MLYVIVALLVIVLDQSVKLWIASNGDMLPKALIPGFVSLVSAENSGGAFSFLADYQNATIIFIAAAGLVALVTIIALATNLVKGGLGRWCLVFISAGGLSNAVDRLMSQGKVQDMIKLDFLEKWKINFPVFNVADVFITVFCILLILYVLFGGRKKADDDEEEEEEDEEEEELDEDEDELEDDEEEDDRPLSRKAKKPERKAEPESEEKPRKGRTSSYEDSYERYKARKARETQGEAAEEKPAPVVNPEDPFAEWERAKAEAPKAAKAEAPKQVKTEEPKPVKESKPAAEKPAPAEEPKPAPKPEKVEAPKPAETPRPTVTAKPKPAPAPAPAAEEFSLEDILAEFK